MPAGVMFQVDAPKKGTKKASKTKKSKRTALTKEQKKETRSIARSTAKSLSDTMYFNALDMNSLNSTAGSETGAGKLLVPSGSFTVPNNRIQVIGYATTNRVVGDSIIDQYSYGVGTSDIAPSPVVNLDMASRYTTVTSGGTTLPHKWGMKGQYCYPSTAKLELCIRRQTNTATSQNPIVVGGLSDIRPYQANGPMKFRVVVCSMRTTNGMNTHYTQEADPGLDLFVDEVGEPTGIDNGLSVLEIELFKTNGRKYIVSLDKTFTLNAPNAYASGIPQQQIGNGIFEKKMTLNFDIGKKIYYEEASQTLPSAGAKNSFVFIHAWYPTLANDNNSYFDMQDVRIGGKAVSTFKDP